MGSPILGSSDLLIIGENRCKRKWVIKPKDINFYLWNKARVSGYT